MIYDNGSGGFVGSTGSVDYTTGAVSVPSTQQAWMPVPIWTLHTANGTTDYHFGSYTYQLETVSMDSSSSISVEYLWGDPLTTQTETFIVHSLIVDFVESTEGISVQGDGEVAVASSLRFAFGGTDYMDQAGAIYSNVSASSGSGVLVGTLNPSTRRVTLTIFPGGVANAPTCQALLTQLGVVPVTSFTLKVDQPPIKSGSFTIYAEQLDGTSVTATATSQGDLIANGIVGAVQSETGIAYVRFGDMIDAAGQAGQPWYDANNVVNGQIFRPKPVVASSIHYDATTEDRSALPADVIKIEIDLLPRTGRLECVRPRDMIYAFHDDYFNVSSPVAGAAFDCGRTLLERVWVMDANGKEISPDLYTATAGELDAGVCHWADPLDLTGYTTPLTVWHRISQVRTVGAVDRFGTLRLRDKPFTRDFPVGAGVSSILYGQSLQADWFIPGFYTPWTGIAAAGTGSTPAAAYDFGNIPPTVKNWGVTMKTRIFIIMQTATTFRVIVEGFQQIDAGVSITSDYAPLNPATQQPIFILWGNRSHTVIVGNGAPNGATGSSGDWYIDATASTIYGPKGQAWPDPMALTDSVGVAHAAWLNVLANYASLADAVGHSVSFTVSPWGTGWNALDYFIIQLTPSNFPIIVGRSTNPSDPVVGMDSGTVEMLGNFG